MSSQTPQKRRRFSPAEKTGLAAILIAFVVWPIDIRLIVLPLGVFLMLCGVAPFLPGFSFFLPIISKGRSDRPAVALTFDDGPDPVTTPLLLELLRANQATATFFVTGRKARRHPHLIRAILTGGHTIGNHSYNHDNCLMFRSTRTVVREIQIAQQVLHRHGIVPLAFRPPVGITNSRLPGAVDATGVFLVNFSRRAYDRGNVRVRNLSLRILNRLQWGDIILLHDSPPRQEHMAYWRDEIQRLLTGLQQRGIAILPLETLIERPVMKIV